MNLLDFLFRIIHAFVPIEKVEFERLENEANTEWRKYDVSKPLETTTEIVEMADADGVLQQTIVEKKPTFYDKGFYQVKKWSSSWQSRLFFAVLFIFAVRWVQDYMNPKEEDGRNNGHRFE